MIKLKTQAIILAGLLSSPLTWSGQALGVVQANGLGNLDGNPAIQGVTQIDTNVPNGNADQDGDGAGYGSECSSGIFAPVYYDVNSDLGRQMSSTLSTALVSGVLTLIDYQVDANTGLCELKSVMLIDF